VTLMPCVLTVLKKWAGCEVVVSGMLCTSMVFLLCCFSVRQSISLDNMYIVPDTLQVYFGRIEWRQSMYEC
jgi:hypothetical protein